MVVSLVTIFYEFYLNAKIRNLNLKGYFQHDFVIKKSELKTFGKCMFTFVSQLGMILCCEVLITY